MGIHEHVANDSLGARTQGAIDRLTRKDYRRTVDI
jgi:hypothetical protein